ncbi:MAG: helix-turn-helix transcriptional regulator [Vallitalea sp.]|jgi:DNA-binding XRE family transcriptional regulator|nr:helix-turn-helix transcriptional regulator [Vallitalea sp.]
MSTLVTQLKRYRLIANMSQDELAKKVNVRRETIVRLEGGKYNPSIKLAFDIAKVFNVTIEEIFTYESIN